MHRGYRCLFLGLLALSAGSLRRVDAQYNYPYGTGYSGGGFGGWSSTVDGDVARGMGAFAAGEGIYNYNTAVANSINANTIVRGNSFSSAGACAA